MTASEGGIVDLSNNFDSTSALYGMLGGGGLLFVAMYFVNYFVSIDRVKNVTAWNMSALELGIRVLLVGTGYLFFALAMETSIRALGLQEFDDIKIPFIVCNVFLGVSAMGMYYSALSGTGANIVTAMKDAKQRVQRIARKGKLASARNTDMLETGALKGGNGASAAVAGMFKRATNYANVLCHFVHLAMAVWLLLILSKSHSAYATLCFLVTTIGLVAAAFMSVNYLSHPEFFRLSHFKENYANHIGRFLVVFGGFVCFGAVQAITVTCNDVVL